MFLMSFCCFTIQNIPSFGGVWCGFDNCSDPQPPNLGGLCTAEHLLLQRVLGGSLSGVQPPSLQLRLLILTHNSLALLPFPPYITS